MPRHGSIVDDDVVVVGAAEGDLLDIALHEQAEAQGVPLLRGRRLNGNSSEPGRTIRPGRGPGGRIPYQPWVIVSLDERLTEAAVLLNHQRHQERPRHTGRLYAMGSPAVVVRDLQGRVHRACGMC